MNGKIATDLVDVTSAFDLGALEGKSWELLRVKKIGALKVLIALVVMSVDALDRHRKLHRAFGRIRCIERNGASNLVETPIKISHPEMFRAKDEGRMNGVDLIDIGAICGQPESERADKTNER